MNAKTLLSAAVGTGGIVERVDVPGGLRRRLMDLGLTPGASVVCLFAAPSGNPRAYRVCGAVIALRSSEAALIYLK